MHASSRIFALTGSLLASGWSAKSYAQDWYNQPESRSGPRASYGSPEVEVSRAPEQGQGLGIGMKLGYGAPMGEWYEDAAFDDFVKGAVHTEFALNYGITPSVILGGYAGLGFGLLPSATKDACDRADDVDCNMFLLNAGLHAEYRFLPGGLLNPWLGANFGLEWAHFSASWEGYEATTSVFGLAFGPSAGLDFQLARWGLGPFLSYQAGRFLSANVDLEEEADDASLGSSGKIDNRAFHGWLTFGVRARYTFAR